MRHLRAHRKLGRTSSHRRALLRNLVTSLFIAESGAIRTTVEKAKEARRMAEKIITLGKREGVHARRLAGRYLADRSVIRRLFEDIAPKFADRNGGYTRVLKLGPRHGDNADLALLELVGIADAARKARATAAKDKKGPAPEKPKEGGDKAAKSPRDTAPKKEGKVVKASSKSKAGAQTKTQ